MIPVRDVIPTRTTPLLTVVLVVVTALLALVPSALLDPHTASFLIPNNLVQVGINTLFLWVFGENVEDRLGHTRFAGLYVACAVAALSAASTQSEAHALVDASSSALAGVLGAYLVTFPQSRVLMLVPIPFRIVEVPAIILIGFWVLLQVLTTSLGTQRVIGSNEWAPVIVTMIPVAVCGLGALLGLALRRRERLRVEWWDEEEKTKVERRK